MIDILQIFRKKNPAYFSIEKVFFLIEPFLEKNIQLQIVHLPYFNTGIIAVFKNLYFLSKKKTNGLYHITGDVHYAALVLPKRRTILTIHDCIFLYSKKGFKGKIIKYLFLDIPVKRAIAISTISEFSKAEIIRFTNCNPQKITVIPNPVNTIINFKEKQFNNVKPVILFVGVTTNKNMERVIAALKGINCKLIILGKLYKNQEELLVKHQIDFSAVHNISEHELAELYEDCDIVLFPSTFEGFGLPIIEGQKAGRVVITSAIEPMQSVAGTGAYFVDPYDINSIRKAIKTIIENTDLRNGLIENGFENIKRYDAETIARAYQHLYQKVADANV